MRKVIMFGLLSLLMTGFIWGNSLQNADQSSAQSTPVAETLQPVLDPHEKMEKPVFHDFVRKLAHVAEFLVLGLCVGGFGASLGAYLKKHLISLPILIVLFVAVTDEFIQHFTGRGSLVTDVVLDFAGSAAGLTAVWFALWMIGHGNQGMKKGQIVNG
jgi:VanZ family protein